MNTKHTWAWVVVATALFAFIFFFEQYWRKPAPGPAPVLPGFKAAAVESVQVRPAGQLEIRADRVSPGGTTWRLTKPIVYPAHAARVESLLTALERLTPATYVTASDLRHRPKADEDYGLGNPQASLVLQQGDNHRQLLLGGLTAPGDQVFLRVVGVEGIYVVDAELLKLIPRATNDWRDTALVDLRSLAFNRLVITNATRSIELRHDPTNRVWSLTHPMRARADTLRMNISLQKLQMLPVTQFVSDNPDADFGAFGLQPAEWELMFANGTNPIVHLYFGKSPTNDAGQVFARREGSPAIVTVASEPLSPWRAPLNDFRDHHLLSLPQVLGPVEVRGDDHFTLLPQTNGWRMTPQDLPVDAARANDFLAALLTMEIEFFMDAVTEHDLRTNGLIVSPREITLKLPAVAAESNAVLAQLSFGTTKGDKLLAAHAGEDSIYALKLADFQQLPWASWQLRERRIWNFTESDVARITIRQAGKAREIQRLGTNSWTLAPGSQGMINGFAIEEAAHRFGELAATQWVERAVKDRTQYGITTNSLSLTFELKNGEKHGIAFGSFAPSQYPYAAVTLDKETWVLEFSLALYQFVASYLTIPANTP